MFSSPCCLKWLSENDKNGVCLCYLTHSFKPHAYKTLKFRQDNTIYFINLADLPFNSNK